MDNQLMQPFRQKPIIEEETFFEITGKELKSIQAISEAWSAFLPTLESILIRNIMNGKINIRYEDLEGNEISKERILEMFTEYTRLQNEVAVDE